MDPTPPSSRPVVVPSDLEVRLQRLRRLLDGRGEDAAKLLRTWLQQQKEAGGRRRR